jgi:hypothetical protein
MVNLEADDATFKPAFAQESGSQECQNGEPTPYFYWFAEF